MKNTNGIHGNGSNQKKSLLMAMLTSGKYNKTEKRTAFADYRKSKKTK